VPEHSPAAISKAEPVASRHMDQVDFWEGVRSLLESLQRGKFDRFNLDRSKCHAPRMK
jgi:hypothetical protein